MALQLKIRPWKKTEERQTQKDQRKLIMELSRIRLSSLNQQLPSSKTHKTLQSSNTRLATIPISHQILSTFSSNSSITKRRTLNLSILAILFSSSLPITIPNATADEERETELQRYTDSKEGFALLRPSSYIQVDKAGATVLFEEENKGSNNIGIVVNPVRLNSLRDFGTPQFVADKLIQAEKRKESTKDAQVIGAVERPGLNNIPVYEFEYILDSTRGGMKRIFSAAFVSGKKLYLLNISHVDRPDSPLDSNTRVTLEEVLHSFDAAPLT